GGAASSPEFYTDYTGFENAAHGRFKCTDCHDPHGAPGGGTQMTVQSDVCASCHGVHAGHSVGASFGKNGKDYTLECTSCHNVHVLTGLTRAETPSKSAMTRFTDNTEVWGDEAGEKMTDFAAGGTYRTPQGEDLAGNEIPDYVTFCLDCHATPQSEFGAHGSITWGGDNHGLVSANVPNGYGTSPNWYTYGQAQGWDGDDVTSEEDAWPVTPRGRGEQIWTRSVYDQEERIKGANFVLSCSNCHDTHATDSRKLKSLVNGATYTGEWKTLCNACHYYYSDWHAGMSCGNANSCHEDPGRNPRAQGYAVSPETIHGMPHATGDSSKRTWDGDLVLDLGFDNNLKDASDFQLDSKWFNQAGSFAAGKSGQAISLSGDQGVQVGTENANWSTDEGYHGTWKYTEMKYNTTMEAWVNPTDSAATEYTVFTKHVGHNDGGYTLALKKIDGTWRAVLNVNVDGTGTGVRGAYSSVDIPVGRWTHIAASFDKDGPDRDPADPSVGRIRIYVDGEDVTTSDVSGTMTQPGAGEDFIFPFSAHSYPGDLDSRDNPYGYDGHWCASEFTVGGFDWQNGFVGSIDEAKLWNVTKPPGYFETADQAAAPRIASATGMIGSDRLTVRFSEGVYSSAGAAGALQPSDFTLTDVDGSRTIVDVAHNPGDATATLTLSSALDDVDDLNVDLLAPAAASVFDEHNNIAPTNPVILAPSGQTPTGEIRFELDEAPGTTFVTDTSGFVAGRVYGSGALTGSAFAGDGTGNYVEFANNSSALRTETTMTIEARIKPEGFSGATGNVVQRVLGRAGSTGNYQTSVWRIIDGTNWPNYHPAAGEASVALWVRVQDAHGGNVWKPVLTEATDAASPEYHPVVSGHWYRMKVVWNTYKSGGVAGQPFVPAEIYLDDEGTDGLGAGERWSGYVDATDANQSQLTADRKLYTDDKILSESGAFRIGTNTPALSNYFNGQIDWISWSPEIR
ncbi:MAG: hypothetical protein HY876_01555, partial [Coriobacteriales bacterium]|nr:hypothetical protein [Coriobacteriales bacterium]